MTGETPYHVILAAKFNMVSVVLKFVPFQCSSGIDDPDGLLMKGYIFCCELQNSYFLVVIDVRIC